jgi:hypothetical protein
MTKKTVFVSFDYDNDEKYKSLMEAWDVNPDFDFSFSDRSVTKNINSSDESRIKAVIATKMRASKYCLILVGEKTFQNNWVAWEIERARKLGLKLIAVKMDQSFQTPTVLYGKNALWVDYGQESILRALKEAEQK